MVWLASLLNVGGYLLIGAQVRFGFLVGAAGCLLWVGEAVSNSTPALGVERGLFLGLSLWGWWKWKKLDAVRTSGKMET